MARGKAHSDETKAAVTAALLAGQGVTEVATRYKLDPSVVSRWRKQIPDGRLQEVATEKGAQIEALLFDYLGANLYALRSQANVAADEAYLRKFPPQQLAVLHGVMADKGIRLLEALAGAREQEGPDSGGDADESAGG